MNRRMGKLGILVAMVALVMGLMAGCSNAASSVNSEQQANRAYMSQVNEIMDRLDGELDAFVDAVSLGDVVAMRTQVDKAYQSLDKLSSLEAPESLSDIKQSYVDGTGKLREALDAYISLYAEMSQGSFDQATYTTRIEKVQTLYNEGVDALKKGDEAAASKQ